MKVKQLIELLGYEDSEAEVCFGYTANDYWRTKVAPTVRAVDNGLATYSTYHEMDKLIEDDVDAYDDNGKLNPNFKEVVVLSGF